MLVTQIRTHKNTYFIGNFIQTLNMQQINFLLKTSFVLLLVVLCWMNYAQAQGEDCGTATVQPIGLAALINFTNANNSGTPDPLCATVAGDNWLSFTVSRRQLLRIEHVLGTLGQDVALTVYSGTCAALTEVACANDVDAVGSILGSVEGLSFTAEAGITYFLRFINQTGTTAVDGVLSISDQFKEGSSSLAVGVCGLDFDIPAGVNPLLSVNPTCFIPTPSTTERWARFVATHTTQIRVRYTNTTENANLVAYNPNGEPIAGVCGAAVGIGTEDIQFPVVAGQEYYVRVINPNNADVVEGTLCIENIASEVRTNAFSVPSLGCVDNFYVFGTGVTDGASCLNPNADQDGWASFTASVTGDYTVSFSNNSEDAGVAIYDNAGTPIGGACANAIVGLGLEKVTFAATQGTTYFIRVSNMLNTNLMGGSLCVYPTDSEADELCADALLIDLSNTDEACGIPFTLPAGASSAELYPSSCAVPASALRDGWATFVAPANQIITIQYNNLSQLDATVVVYRGTCGTLTLEQCANSNTGFGTETTTINAIGGTTYFIRVINTTTEQQDMPGELCVFTGNAPATDLCSNAQPISIGTCDYDFGIPSNAINNENIALPTGCSFPIFRDGWVSFPVVNGQTFSVRYQSEDSEAALAVYSGNCNALTPLACSTTPFANGEVRLTYQPDFTGTIYLRVIKTDEAGPMTGTLCVSDMIARDECADAYTSPVKLQIGDCNIEFNVPLTFSPSSNDVDCSIGGNPAGWVAYEADFTGSIRVDYTSIGDVAFQMAIYNAPTCDVTTNSALACLTGNNSPGYGSLQIDVAAGQTYLVKVVNSSSGPATDLNGNICLYRSDLNGGNNFLEAPTFTVGLNCGEQINLAPSFNPTGSVPGLSTVVSCDVLGNVQSDAWVSFVAPASDVLVEFDNRSNSLNNRNDVALLVYESLPITVNNAASGQGLVEDLIGGITADVQINQSYENIDINNTGVDGPGVVPSTLGIAPADGDAWARINVGADANLTFTIENATESVAMVLYQGLPPAGGGIVMQPLETPEFFSVNNASYANLPAGTYFLHLVNNSTNPITGATLNVYGDGLLTEVACTNTVEEGIERITLDAADLNAGETYYVRIANLTDQTVVTSGRLCLRDNVVPQGDLCDNPFEPLVGFFCDRDFNLDNTFSNNQPIPDPVCLDGSGFNYYKDGWLRFTATTTRTTVQYQIESASAGVSTSMIAIYRGTCIAPFLIGCTNPGDPEEAGRVRTLKFNTIPGQEYLVRIMSVGIGASTGEMNGKICLFNTAERDVCNDDDLVTLTVNDCNIRFDVPRSFELTGANLRNFPAGQDLPIPAIQGQEITSSCEPEHPFVGTGSFTDTDTNPALTAGQARDAWIRMTGQGELVTLTYQNNEVGTLPVNGSDPAIVIYTFLQADGPVNCGVGENGAGNELNQFACANNITAIGKQTESVTFLARAGQRYIIRVIDINGGNQNGMTGSMCISSGSQSYDECTDARSLEVGDCSVPLNVIDDRNTCYVPPINAGAYPDITGGICNLPAGLGADGCGGNGDTWARLVVTGADLPAGTLPITRTVGANEFTDLTIEYDNRNYTFDIAADVALVVYRVNTDCEDANNYTIAGCADALGAGEEGIEFVTIRDVAQDEVYYVRVINKTAGQSLFGKICLYYGEDIADDACPTTQTYGELNGEFRNFTVLSSWTNTSQPSNTITNPPCVLPGGSRPRTLSPNPIRSQGWISFTAPDNAGLTPSDPRYVAAVTIQYDNSGLASGGLQNAAIAVYTANNANPDVLPVNCQEAQAVGDNQMLIVDCVDTVFEGAESVTIGVEAGRTYYIRVMNITDSPSISNMPGRIRIFPYAPCNVGEELVVDGNFEGWSPITPMPMGDTEANNITQADFDRRLDDHMYDPRVLDNQDYPTNELDSWTKFATDYGFVRDKTGGGVLPNAQGIDNNVATYQQFTANRGELGPEGRYTVKQSPWSVKGDWFSFGNGYSGYGGRTGGGLPQTNYCVTGAGAGGEPCIQVTRNFGNGPETTDGEFNIGLGIPRPFPYTSDANFMIVNGSFDPASGLPPGKVWCQTIQRDGARVGYYVFTVWVQNMISAGRNLDVPQLRLSVCDMEDPITGTFPPATTVVTAIDGGPVVRNSVLPGVSFYDPNVAAHTVHFPRPPRNRVKAPRVDFQYGAARSCNTSTESRDARLKVLGSSFLINENPDAWQVVRCIYRAPLGVNEMNICIENLSLTKNGNDFGIDDISFRECLNPNTEAFDRLLRGDPCELADTPNSLDIPLNVTMLDFSGRLAGDRVFLNWITLQEANAGYYEVQRSTDGANFARIGEVMVKGNPESINSYDFIDYQLPQGVNYLYYRLRIVNQDGTSKMGPFIMVDVAGLDTFDLQIFPNPTEQGDAVTLRYNVGEGMAGLVVADMMGNVLIQDLITTRNGLNETLLNTQKLPAGIYIVQIRHNGQRASKRLVVY